MVSAMTELPLIVGVDGSDAGLAAVDRAVDAAARLGLPLRLVHASLWERYEGALALRGQERPSVRVLAEHIVACAAERARRRNPDVKVSTAILASEPADALLGEGNNASLLVTGSRGRGELRGLLLGSVGLAVAARAHCPVTVVRGDGPWPGRHPRAHPARGREPGHQRRRGAFRLPRGRGTGVHPGRRARMALPGTRDRRPSSPGRGIGP
ncbi:hypothetical protein GCM10010350_37910 [Streptomyces galilaeus]|nr:hypothetical protein GCM10010350_37910 [Streptomyces galilaeus]